MERTTRGKVGSYRKKHSLPLSSYLSSLPNDYLCFPFRGERTRGGHRWKYVVHIDLNDAAAIFPVELTERMEIRKHDTKSPVNFIESEDITFFDGEFMLTKDSAKRWLLLAPHPKPVEYLDNTKGPVIPG